MNKKQIISPCLVLVFLLGFVSCDTRQEQRGQRLLDTETAAYADEEVDAQRVKELERHIKKFSDEAEETVKMTGELGIYYRMVALEYMDQEMFGPALDYLFKALEVYPNNHILHYYTGLSLSQYSGAAENAGEREARLREAAYHYQRAVELRSSYFEAHYALAVLYIYELDRLRDAEEHILRALDLRSGDTKSLFLLAHIRVVQRRIEEAVEVYERIIDESSSEEARRRARENLEMLLRGRYNG
ncbi:MAG TPA: hypothetical protein ENN41_08010 [Sediminispirochaeta sp.]|nr:hypothetical protein [Sediminispirochaeta sp.]